MIWLIRLFALMVASLFLMLLLEQQRVYLEVLALTPVDPLPQAQTLIEEGQLAEAEAYLSFLIEQGEERIAVKMLLAKIEKKRASLSYQSLEFAKGVVTGQSEELVGVAGSIIADLSLVGDVRDMLRAGWHWVHPDKEVDPVLVALSAVGLGSGVATLVSAGATVPTKIGVSMLKLARRTQRFPAWLLTQLRQAELSSIRVLANKVGTLGKRVGIPSAIALLSRSRSAEQLTSMVTLAQQHGSRLLPMERLVGVPALVKVADYQTSAVQAASRYGASGIDLLKRVGDVRWMVVSSRVSKIGYKQVWLRNWSAWLLRVPTSFLQVALGFSCLCWLPWEWIGRNKQ